MFQSKTSRASHATGKFTKKLELEELPTLAERGVAK